jgi:hypothetical protein
LEQAQALQVQETRTLLMTSNLPCALRSADFLVPCATDRVALAKYFVNVRAVSLALATSLSTEDQGAQSEPEANPTKWHLAHTTRFFEAVVLMPYTSCVPFDPSYLLFFKSYYESLGRRHPEAQRRLLTRPSLSEVHRYREHIDAAVLKALDKVDWDTLKSIGPLIILGLQLEQQHQERIATDALLVFSCKPLPPTLGVPDNGPSRLRTRWKQES